MIRNETEYQEAVHRLDEENKRIADHEARLKEMGLGPDELKRALDPLRSFHLQLREEVESYERLKRGELGELTNLHGLGRTLVALRISLGLTQRELAERLDVHESQVSRDERNEYHGITVERVSRILDALQVHLTSRFEEPVVPQSSPPTRHIEPDFAAVVAPGLHLAFQDHQRIELRGHTIVGEWARRAVRVCGPGAYVVLKALAFDRRGENKDAYDLFYLLQNLGSAVATNMRALLADASTNEALEILRRDFSSHRIGERVVTCGREAGNSELLLSAMSCRRGLWLVVLGYEPFGNGLFTPGFALRSPPRANPCSEPEEVLSSP